MNRIARPKWQWEEDHEKRKKSIASRCEKQERNWNGDEQNQ